MAAPPLCFGSLGQTSLSQLSYYATVAGNASDTYIRLKFSADMTTGSAIPAASFVIKRNGVAVGNWDDGIFEDNRTLMFYNESNATGATWTIERITNEQLLKTALGVEVGTFSPITATPA
jgi:hypothetical protein